MDDGSAPDEHQAKATNAVDLGGGVHESALVAPKYPGDWGDLVQLASPIPRSQRPKSSGFACHIGIDWGRGGSLPHEIAPASQRREFEMFDLSTG